MSTQRQRLRIDPYYNLPDPVGFYEDSPRSSPWSALSSLSSSWISQAASDQSPPQTPHSVLMGQRSEWRLFFALCLYDFHSDDPDHLSFRKSEILEVVQKETSGWWAAMRESQVGWVPSSFLAELSDSEADKLRCVREDIRVYEFEAERLYAMDPNRRNSDSIESVFPFVRSLKQTRDHAHIREDELIWKSDDGHGPISLRDLFATDLLEDEPEKEQEDCMSSGCASKPSATMATDSIRHADMPEDRSSSSTLTLCINKPALLPCSPSPLSTSACASPLSPYSRVRLGSDLTPRLFMRGRPGMANDFASLSELPMCASSSSARNSEDANAYADDDLCSIYDEYQAKMPAPRRSNKVLQLTGDDDAQAFHNAKLALASLPWYLQPSYTPDVDIKLEYDGSVRAGTLPALVERLTADSLKMTEEKYYRDVLLMTFCTFTSAKDLFDLLVERYEMDHPRELTQDQFTEWRSKRMRRVQARILAILTMWLEDHHLLEQDPDVASNLKDFLKLIRSPPSQAFSAKLLLQSLEKRAASANQTQAAPSLQSNPAKRQKNSARQTEKDTKDISRFDPADVAAQLMLYEYRLYAKILPRECLLWTKSSEKGSERVANLTAFCSTHDKLAAWVKNSVLSHEGLGKRASMIDYWIRVAEKCRSLQNFSSMSAIVAALSSCALSKLHLTWAHVARSNQLESLVKLMDPSGNFSAYRSTLQAVGEGTCVPFIGVFLTDIVHIQDKLKDNVSFPIPPMLHSVPIDTHFTSSLEKSLPTSDGVITPSTSTSSYYSSASRASFSSSFSSSTSSSSSESRFSTDSSVSSSAPLHASLSEKSETCTASDGVPTTSPLINFVKRQRLYEAVCALTRFQNRRPSRPENASLQALIAEQLEKSSHVSSISGSANSSSSSLNVTSGCPNSGADTSIDSGAASSKGASSASSPTSRNARPRRTLSNEAVFWKRARELENAELTALDLNKGLEAASEFKSSV